MKYKVLFITILILTLSFNCAYAVYKSDDILANLTTLRDKGVISGLPTDFQSNNAWSDVTYYQNVSWNANGGYVGYFIGKTSSNSSYYPDKLFIGFMFRSTFNSTTPQIVKSNNVPSSNAGYYQWATFDGNTNTPYFSSSSFSLNGSSGAVGTFDYDKVTWDYFFTTIPVNTRTWVQEANTEYGGSYLIGPNFEFNATTLDGYITVRGSGESAEFIRRPFSYTNSSTRLGYITNINDYYYIEGKFGPFVTPSIVDSQYGFIKNQVGTYNGQLMCFSNGEVKINTSKLVNNQGYSLYFIYKMSANDDYHYSDYYYYYTYKYGTNPSSGDVVSLELDSNLDIGMVNALDDYFNYTSGDLSNIDYLINNSTSYNSGDFNASGDFFISGDIFGITYNDFDNWGLGDTVFYVFNQLRNALINFDDVTLNFGLLGNMSSANFIIENTTLMTFISLISNFLIIFLCIRFLFHVVHCLATADLTGINSATVDHVVNLF